jgi:threonine/homoserine/homoserine lactone efflux protein
MSWQEYATLFVFCTAMSFSPGPNTMLATALAANHGLRRALRFCVAVPTGWTVLMLACGLGLGVLIADTPVLRLSVKLVGLGYMLWLAMRLAATRQMAQVDASRLDLGFWQGAALQFVNIKAWMLALTLTAGWITPGPNPGQRLLIVCLTMVGFAFSSNFSYALMGSLMRQWLSVGTRLVWFNRFLATLLLATALWMVTV